MMLFSSDNRLLRHYAMAGKVDEMEQLLSKLPKDKRHEALASRNWKDRTALHLAVLKGQVKAVDFLLKQQAQLDDNGNIDKTKTSTLTHGKDKNGNTPFLQNAVGASRSFGKKHLQIAVLLLENGADVKEQDKQGMDILHILAAQPSCYEAILLHRQTTLGIPFVPVIQETRWSQNGNNGSGNKHVTQLLAILLDDKGLTMDESVYKIAQKTRALDGVRPGASSVG